MKIKVLHIIWSANFGGIEKVVYDLATTQAENNNCEVFVAACKKGGDFEQMFFDADFKFYKGFLNNTWQILAYRKLLQLIRKVDIVHLHQFNPVISILCAIFAKKIIYSEHGNFGVGRKAKKGEKLLNYLKKRFLEKKVNSVIFNSHFTQNYSKKLYDPKDKGLVIHNGSLPAKASSLQVSTDFKDLINGRFVIGYVGRLAGVKRLDRLIDSFSLMTHKDNAMLLIVGDGDRRIELENQVINKGLENQVVFCGYQSNTEYFYSLMNVCVFPSVNESFGLVAVEALRQSKPVLLFSDAGGMLEVVEGTDENIVADTEFQMAELLDYWSNNSMIITEGAGRRKNRAEDFSIKKMESKTYQLYRNVWN